MDRKQVKLAEHLVALVTLALIVVVADGNWKLRRRVRKLETSLGL